MLVPYYLTKQAIEKLKLIRLRGKSKTRKVHVTIPKQGINENYKEFRA